jgi:hypothetical protein
MGKLQIEKHIKREIMVSDCRLLSGCIYLLTASVGRQDMELNSADVLQTISETLKNVLEVCLIPADRLWTFAPKKHLDALLSTYEEILRLLTTLASDTGLPETTLIKFEATMLSRTSWLVFLDEVSGSRVPTAPFNVISITFYKRSH